MKTSMIRIAERSTMLHVSSFITIKLHFLIHNRGNVKARIVPKCAQNAALKLRHTLETNKVQCREKLCQAGKSFKSSLTPEIKLLFAKQGYPV